MIISYFFLSAGSLTLFRLKEGARGTTVLLLYARIPPPNTKRCLPEGVRADPLQRIHTRHHLAILLGDGERPEASAGLVTLLLLSQSSWTFAVAS